MIALDPHSIRPATSAWVENNRPAPWCQDCSNVLIDAEGGPIGKIPAWEVVPVFVEVEVAVPCLMPALR